MEKQPKPASMWTAGGPGVAAFRSSWPEKGCEGRDESLLW